MSDVYVFLVIAPKKKGGDKRKIGTLVLVSVMRKAVLQKYVFNRVGTGHFGCFT